MYARHFWKRDRASRVADATRVGHRRVIRRRRQSRHVSYHDAQLINDPKHWRDRAEEARAHADEMNDPEAKRQMLEIARGYDRLAERAELVAGPAVGVAMRQGDSLMRSYATGKESPLTRTTHCKPPHEAGEAIPAHHRRIPSGLIRFNMVARIVAAIN